MILLSHQIEKIKMVLSRITNPTYETLILENQVIIMEKMIEMHSMLESLKNK